MKGSQGKHGQCCLPINGAKTRQDKALGSLIVINTVLDASYKALRQTHKS